MSEGEMDEFGRVRKIGRPQAVDNRPSSIKEDDHRDRETLDRNKESDNGEGHHYGPADEKEDILHPGLVIQGEVVRIEPYGAFLDFQDRLQHRHKGLCHISQLANYRVENVTDILKMNQKIYAVILEVQFDQRSGQRIRLSLKDVNQETGKYTGGVVRTASGHGRRSGPKMTPHRLQIRAKLRRETFLSLQRDWKDTSFPNPNEPVMTDKDNSYLRMLYSASPEPPAHVEGRVTRDKKKNSEDKSSSPLSSSSSSSDSDDDSSSSISSGGDKRRRRRRNHVSSRNGRSSRSNRKEKQSTSSRRRRRRRRDRKRISSSSSSSSSSTSSSSTSSSESSHCPPLKKSKREEHDKTEVGLDNEPIPDSDMRDARELKQALQGEQPVGDDEGDNEEGPIPLLQPTTGGRTGGDGSASYGKALLPGEGQALAQYVQQNLRIPRRGEIGYAGDDIDRFEKSGYVMSGSRHKRMNAVRIRKENQVYSAEEQRAFALLTMEENQQKEAQLMEDFRTMLKEKQKLRQDGAK